MLPGAAHMTHGLYVKVANGTLFCAMLACALSAPRGIVVNERRISIWRREVFLMSGVVISFSGLALISNGFSLSQPVLDELKAPGGVSLDTVRLLPKEACMEIVNLLDVR